MAELKYVGDSWTQIGPEELFVTPGQEVDLPLDDQEISELLATGDWEQVDSPESNDSDQLWGSGTVRAFLSHKADYKTAAAGLKDGLRQYGIAAFVAHEDITPTREWEEEILRALNDMDLMIPLLTPGFQESEWTGQEIGFAIARSVPMIPVRHGSDPFGFIGRYQALNWQGGAYSDLAARIFELMLDSEQPALRELGTNAYVNAVSNASSFAEANWLALYLSRVKRLSLEQLSSLVQAFNTNSQVRGSHRFRQALAPRLSELTGEPYVVSPDSRRDGRIHRMTL